MYYRILYFLLNCIEMGTCTQTVKHVFLWAKMHVISCVGHTCPFQHGSDTVSEKCRCSIQVSEYRTLHTLNKRSVHA